MPQIRLSFHCANTRELSTHRLLWSPGQSDFLSYSLCKKRKKKNETKQTRCELSSRGPCASLVVRMTWDRKSTASFLLLKSNMDSLHPELTCYFCFVHSHFLPKERLWPNHAKKEECVLHLTRASLPHNLLSQASLWSRLIQVPQGCEVPQAEALSFLYLHKSILIRKLHFHYHKVVSISVYSRWLWNHYLIFIGDLEREA